MNKITSATIANLLIFNLLNAQQTAKTDPNRGMGFNVVIMVVAIIFVGLAIYLISIDRKLSKLEKEVN
ncbi:MAG: CcmD family protein [Saprospiraceae bacterium]|nr:CcmD family protein [Saprospiraceae bacterium]